MTARTRQRQAERGTTLLETALAAALMGSLLVFINAIVNEEMARQRDQSLGQQLHLMTKFAHRYLKNEFLQVQNQLASLSTTDAIAEISMKTLIDEGYLPSSFGQNGKYMNSENQTFAILVRGVSRLDKEYPQQTLKVAAIDADDDDKVDSKFVDGDTTNDEMDIEALLVTSGGKPLDPQHGHPAVLAADLATAGYVQTAGIAKGPFGNWSMDISAFASLDGYPKVGRFVSLLALSGFGVLDFWDKTTNNGNNTLRDNLFERCPSFTGQALAECIANNDVYTNLRFRAIDSDDDGKDDRFPEISGLLKMACASTNTELAVSGTLLIDCTQIKLRGRTTIDGDVTVAGDADFSGQLQITSKVSAERFVASAIGNQDLTKGVYEGQIMAMNGTREIDKPVCQKSDEAMILVAPAAYASPDGSPIVGIKAFAANKVGDPKKWMITMQAALDRDSNVDGEVDVVNLASADDHVLALTRCR